MLLTAVLPEFALEVEAALIRRGRESLARQVECANIDRFTHYARDDLGYIYFVRPRPSPYFAKLAGPVAETVVFYAEAGFNVDVDHDGYLFGFELEGRSEVMDKLVAKMRPKRLSWRAIFSRRR